MPIPSRRAIPGFRPVSVPARLTHGARVFAALFLAGAAVWGVTGCEATPQGYKPLPPSRPVEAPPAKAHAASTLPIDVEHYAIDIAVFPESRSLEATCSIRYAARLGGLERVELDLSGLGVRGVRDGSGAELPFRQDDRRLIVDLVQPLAPGATGELHVTYAGEPRKGLWFAGDQAGIPTHCFTQGECVDASSWFPCQDTPADRATSEVRVTMPARWVSVAAGERIGRTESGATVTEHWRMDFPHPPYLVTLVAGELAVQRSDWNGVELSFLSQPQYASWMAASFEETGEILDFLSDLTGVPYPYPKYSQACVENFPFGGMENISATTLTELTLKDERGNRDQPSTSLVAHEAAHQWFGDYVTCEDWSHIWLNEGFATYMALLYFEHSRGVDDFRLRMRDTIEEYVQKDVGKDRRPTVWNVYRDPSDLFSTGQSYQGGAARLHLLRFVLGDQAFFDGVRVYLAEHAGGSVVTADLREALEKVSGQDLGWFFQQWFHSSGYPELTMSWEWDERRQQVRVDVEQVQEPRNGTPTAFRMPVDIEVRDARGSVLHRVTVDERKERFELRAPQAPLWVRFDKHGWIPKRLESKKSADEWLAIAAKDEDPNGRREAIRKLGLLAAETFDEHNKEIYRAEIVNRLRTETLAPVRVIAAEALGVVRGIEAREHLIRAATADSDAAVRAQALKSLARWGADPQLASLGRAQFENGYSWTTMAAAAGLVCAADPENAYSWLSRCLLVESPHDFLRSNLMVHLADLGTDAAVDQLVHWATNEQAKSLTRAAAAKELGRVAEGKIPVSRALAGLVDTRDNRLRAAVIEALVARKDYVARRALESYYPDALLPREKRAIEAAFDTRVGVR